MTDFDFKPIWLCFWVFLEVKHADFAARGHVPLPIWRETMTAITLKCLEHVLKKEQSGMVLACNCLRSYLNMQVCGFGVVFTALTQGQFWSSPFRHCSILLTHTLSFICNTVNLLLHTSSKDDFCRHRLLRLASLPTTSSHDILQTRFSHDLWWQSCKRIVIFCNSLFWHTKHWSNSHNKSNWLRTIPKTGRFLPDPMPPSTKRW